MVWPRPAMNIRRQKYKLLPAFLLSAMRPKLTECCWKAEDYKDLTSKNLMNLSEYHFLIVFDQKRKILVQINV
jgi:hypothetical protein